MNRFVCGDGYKEALRAYTEEVLEKNGIASQSSERETICMADEGNIAALKFYADMVFYKKLLRRNPYREAFCLYMQSAGITVNEAGEWSCSGLSYPLSFWSIGYCLVNYRRESFLKDCEVIDVIEKMSLNDRLSIALELAASCITYVDSAAAANLIGRILHEASENDELFTALRPVILEAISGHDFPKISLEAQSINDREQCYLAAEKFFQKAAQNGYVYASNNLAAREADRISAMSKEGQDESVIRESILRYIEYLKLSADKYEPYAANRLGLFYVTGEIKGASGTYVNRSYIDTALAKEYFKKAVVYPNENSAWAFFNLIKYFHKDYDSNIELTNEHMDYIKALNSRVYDIAMEL